VQEHRGEYPSLWAAVESIAPKIITLLDRQPAVRVVHSKSWCQKLTASGETSVEM
jgi:hypothetical protein